MAIAWVTIFLDFPADSFDAGVAFWRAATGYGRSAARGDDGQFATLQPTSGDAYLRVQRVRDATGGCHLDLHVDVSTEPLAAVAERASALGARTMLVEDGLVAARSPGGFPYCLVDWDGERTVPPPLAEAAADGSDGSGNDGADGDGGAEGAVSRLDAASRLDTLCLDVPPQLFDRELAFWERLTGWAAHPAAVAGFATLERPAGLPVRLLVQRRDEAPPGAPVRGHVDFGGGGPGAVARHVRLGARVTATFPHWTVLTDPAGRQYCLVNRPVKT